MQCKVANRQQVSSEAYLSCQRHLLTQEYLLNIKTIRTLNKITSMKNTLHKEMSVIDYELVITTFLVPTAENISKIHKNHG